MKHPRNIRFKRAFKNILMLTIAGMINAFGITIFMTPVKLYDSGISGTSMLLEQITPPSLTLSLFLLILNVPLFLFGLKKQGAGFTFYSIYAVGVYSLFAWLITDVFPVDVEHSIAARRNRFVALCAVRRRPFRYRKRSCYPLRRGNGRH